MARRLSRRLHGLGSATASHKKERAFSVKSAISLYNQATTLSAEGKCKTALNLLNEGSMHHGMMLAHAFSGGGVSDDSKIRAAAMEADEMFAGACITRSKLSGLGRARKSRRRARR